MLQLLGRKTFQRKRLRVDAQFRIVRCRQCLNISGSIFNYWHFCYDREQAFETLATEKALLLRTLEFYQH